MTPKEALNQLSGVAWQYLTDGYVTVNGKRYTIKDLCDINLKALTELEELKRYPTSEEVCEAIQKELGYGTVVYFEGNREFIFFNHGEKQNITDCYGDRYKVTGFYKSSTLSLIGRFYEGMEKKDV